MRTCAQVVIGRFNLYLISLAYALKHAHLDDLLGMGLYWAWYGALTLQLPQGLPRTVFVLTSHFAVGVLHVQLLVSHLGTEQLTVEQERACQWFNLQLRTTRNIDTTWWDAWFHGGLQYQIEHHLCVWPRRPAAP